MERIWKDEYLNWICKCTGETVYIGINDSRNISGLKNSKKLLEDMGHIWNNVKCDPNPTYMWRSSYKFVVAAYHMNKYYWNSVILDGIVLDDDNKNIIDDRFDLKKPN